MCVCVWQQYAIYPWILECNRVKCPCIQDLVDKDWRVVRMMIDDRDEHIFIYIYINRG